MTQDERWLSKYNEVKTFIETNHRNPSKHHPREDNRLFSIYDEIEKENPKYTLLLVYILDFWAKMCEIGDYPKDLEPIGESVAKIKCYFKVK